MNKITISAIASACIFSLSFGAHADFKSKKPSNTAFTIAVFGDAPYDPSGNAEFEATPAFINNINQDKDVSLVMHVGDIHSGSQACTEAYDRAIFNMWTAFSDPLIYTPGDNEWADCHKKKEMGGAYDATTDAVKYVTDANGQPVDYAAGNPVDNLKLVREIFFANPGYTLGKEMRVFSQSELAEDHDEHHHSTDQKFVENVMWTKGEVLFVAVNIPGGSNNGSDAWYGTPNLTNQQAQEIAERTSATIHWLQEAFDQAERSHAKAMVIETQADMWDLDGNPASHIANYKTYIDTIAHNAASYGKPVLLLNGDSHVYRSDNPLVQNSSCFTETGHCSNDAYASHANGYQVPNFHRITVHGSTFPLEWLKLTIDTSVNNVSGSNTFGPFSWQRMIQATQ